MLNMLKNAWTKTQEFLKANEMRLLYSALAAALTITFATVMPASIPFILGTAAFSAMGAAFYATARFVSGFFAQKAVVAAPEAPVAEQPAEAVVQSAANDTPKADVAPEAAQTAEAATVDAPRSRANSTASIHSVLSANAVAAEQAPEATLRVTTPVSPAANTSPLLSVNSVDSVEQEAANDQDTLRSRSSSMGSH